MCNAHIIIYMNPKNKNIPNNQIKSKKRVSEKGEVFTAEREVKAMCDLVKDETERIDSRFLEPACGNGNFLAEILTRKLAVCKRKYKKSAFDYERFSLLALGSIYGVDIMQDNAKECRERLYQIWEKEYKTVCKKECNDATRATARIILQHNIVCGNALTLKCVDANGNDINEPIVFSEWTFPRNDAFFQRTDYKFAEILEQETPNQDKKQRSIFDDEKNDGEGTFLQKFVCHYRRLSENE